MGPDGRFGLWTIQLLVFAAEVQHQATYTDPGEHDKLWVQWYHRATPDTPWSALLQVSGPSSRASTPCGSSSCPTPSGRWTREWRSTTATSWGSARPGCATTAIRGGLLRAGVGAGPEDSGSFVYGLIFGPDAMFEAAESPGPVLFTSMLRLE